MTVPAAEDRLLTPAEVGEIFRVDPATALPWARQRRIASVLTPGGHRRFRESAVRSFLAQHSTGAIPDA